MSYSSKETSVQDSCPIHLFQFNRNPSSVWRYAAFPVNFTAQGHTWYPEAITTGNISTTGDVPRDVVEVKLPVTNNLAASFLGAIVDSVTTVTIFRTHYDDSDFIVLWKGRVASISVTMNLMTMVCEPIFTSMRRVGLRSVYSRSCRHMLYHKGCNVNRDDYAVTGTVVSVNRNKVWVSLGGQAVRPGDYLKAPDGTLRMVMSRSLMWVTLKYPFPSLQAGDNITYYPGCDKSTRTCSEVFHNIGNYGGQPGMTGINPMDGRSKIF